MRRFLPVLFSFLLLIPIVALFQPKPASANAVLRIVAGTVAENAMIAIAEKAGVKYGTMTAREKALQRWNWDWKELDKITDDEIRQRLADFETQINRAPTPIPERPGFGKLVLSTAAFLTGADLVLEAYHAFQQGKENAEYVSLLAEHDYLVQQGERIVELPNVSVVEVPPYFGSDGDVGYDLHVNGTSVPLFDAIPGTLIYWFDNIGAEHWVMNYIRKFTTSGRVETSQGAEDFFYTQPAEPFGVGFIPSDVHIPNVNIPEVLQPYVDGDLSTFPEEVPNTLPQTVEVVVPIDQPYPIDETLNDPLSNPNPDQNPDQNPDEDPDGDPDGDPVLGNPFDLPVDAIAGLLCILKSVILYLIRLFQFLISIPNAAPVPFGNAAFEWFRTARIMGVQIYGVISSLASIGLSVAVYKAIRKVIP